MEFALVLPAIAMLIVLAVEVSVVARVSLVVMAAAREGARVSATTSDTDQTVDAALEALGPELAETMRVSVRRPSVVGEPTSVEVSGQYRALAWLGGVPVPLSFTSTMRVER